MKKYDNALKIACSLKTKRTWLALLATYFVVNLLLQFIPIWTVVVLMSNISFITMPLILIVSVFMSAFLGVKFYQYTRKTVFPVIVFLITNILNYYLASWMINLFPGSGLNQMGAGIAMFIYYLAAMVTSNIGFIISIIITKIVYVSRVKKQI